MSNFKIVAASAITVLYIALAIGVVRTDRGQNVGSFINLNGIISAIITFPISFPLEFSGHKTDFRSNWQMALLIAGCAALVFGVTYGTLSFVQYLRNAPTVVVH